jgi:TolB-like protein/DNA-binding winged helix-turn-helix (wHTH) protein
VLLDQDFFCREWISVGFECYRIGDLVLDAGTQEVTRNGSPVPVPRLSFKLLLSLVRHAPNVVSVQTLEQEVWRGLIVDKGTINKRVLLLRKALGEDKGEGPYITVIRGSGYRLDVPVERVASEREKTEPPKEESRAWYQRSSAAIRTISYWLLGIVAILALWQGIQNKSPATSSSAGGINQTTAQPAVAYDRRFLAVMPFVDLSDGKAHQYLGDGIAEEVINLLAGMEGLEVAARTSSFSFRDTSLTAMDIADDLHVGTILEGSLRHDGDQIRVTAQLIDTRNGFHIWSKTYDRTFSEVFEVQDDIALGIAQALKLTFADNGKPDSGKHTTSNIEAFSMYLKGRELFNARIRLRSEGLREALDYFWKAVELDPEFTRAHAGIASVYWLLTSYDPTLDQDDYFEQAVESAHFALEIDPDSIDALSVLASIHAARGEIELAVAKFDQIRSIGSNDSNIIHWQAMLHMRLGYFDELIGELSDAYRHDPLNEHIGWSLATAYNFSGQPEEAEKILLTLKDFTYRDYNLGLAAINEGDYPKAREYLRNVQLRSGVLPAAYADMLIDALEKPQGVAECAKMIVSASRQRELDKLVAFEALLILGSPLAFELEIDPFKIYKLQILTQVWNNWGVELRRDVRFKEWVEKLNYVAFWRKYGWPDRCRPTGPSSFECI